MSYLQAIERCSEGCLLDGSVFCEDPDSLSLHQKVTSTKVVFSGLSGPRTLPKRCPQCGQLTSIIISINKGDYYHGKNVTD